MGVSGIGTERGSHAAPQAVGRGSAGSPGAADDAQDASSKSTTDDYTRSANGKKLSADDQALIAKLQARDREVRAHEAAHQAAGGNLVGGASFSYQNGPDGKTYAIGGEVSIDISTERTPSATITKMERVVAAAMAPAQPSGQDQSVAARAQAAAQQARAEQARTEQDGSSNAGSAKRSYAAAASGSSDPATGSLIDVSA